MAFAAGDRVTVRGERWVVDEATTFAGTNLLSLLSTESEAAPRRGCRLLAPFDRPVPAVRSRRIRAVTRRMWMRHLQTQVSELHACGALRAAQHASINILPFQLEPALALVRGHASRFLLSDEVGLGKTIQAGLMLAELLRRGWCERALIVTPAGLRQQWADELRHRFDIHPAVIDAASLAALTVRAPFDVNPWTLERVAIASIDFLKQPEVLRGLVSQLWDVLVVDEAHQATVASLRYDAVNALAKRARHVMLLTATPHAGDDRAYRALCAIGKVADDDPILLFRRTRELAGLPRSRRAHLLPVKPTQDGIEMHRQLDTYLARLWQIAREPGKRDVQLVAMVLAKRAFSSARSLAASLERRVAGLSGETEGPAQVPLPFGPENDESDEAPMPVAPAFERADEERTVLQQLIDAARRAQTGERKMHALERLARRVREPIIVFTEYRDTLDAIREAMGAHRRITTLHGGQTAEERRQSIDTFTTGHADLMIATDAGSEGLNLQGTCRLVVNLELPWNPIRLEQRIGRVDRIGQTRTVHAINLFADGTAERTVLASLLRRVDRIRMSEIEIGACVISQSEPPPRPVPLQTWAETIDLSAPALAEAHRLAAARRRTSMRSNLPEYVVPVSVVKSPVASLIAFFRIRLVTHAGRLIEDSVAPVRIPVDPPQQHLTRRAARALAESLVATAGPALARRARVHADERARTIARESAQSIARAVRRERAVADCAAAHGPHLVQAGLFDTRALKQTWVGNERLEAIRHESDARASLLEAGSTIRLAHEPELAMVLILCSPA